MKSYNFKFISILLYLIFLFGVTFVGCPEVFAAGVDFVAGEYVSSDGKHTIDIASDNTALYDDTYSLKVNDKTSGDTITGKIGTDNKSVTFYQLNDSKIANVAVISYTHAGVTSYLYDYTVFSLDKTPVVDDAGSIEVWHAGVKVNAFSDFQSAVDAAMDGDTIKITSNLNVSSGAYVKGKNLIIEGNNNTLSYTTWLNSIFVVEEGASLTINNLTIDGGASGFEVDKSSINIQTGTSTTIPIKSGSDSGDLKKNMSLIVSKGNLITNSSTFNNHYINGDGSVINALSGTLTIKNSTLNHNRATNKGGSLIIGRKVYDDENYYPVLSVLIEDSNINNCYSKNGGAIYLLNAKETNIIKANFKGNTVTGGKGAVILYDRQSSGSYYSVAEKFGIELPTLNVDQSLFEENWVGNDGSAFEIHDSVLTVTNSTFRKNVGIHSTSSCGCISFVTESLLKRTATIDNCIFEENMGSASVIADHGSAGLTFNISNTQFKRNKAVYNTFLMYSADFNFDNCVFENEYASRGIIDLRPAATAADLEHGYKIPVVRFKDVIFKNTEYAVTDILIRKYEDNDEMFPVTVILEGNTEANIDVWYNNKLQINGNHKGNINVMQKSNSKNIVLSENASIEKNINFTENKNLITLILYGLESVSDYNWQARRYIYSDNRTFIEEEFFLEHQLVEDGYKLTVYTDSAYTNLWNYTVDGDMTLYGRWEEHTHSFDGTLVVYENAIYEQCECGYLGKNLYLEVPTDLVENDLEKPVVVNNNLGLTDSDYVITYQVMNEDGSWITYEGIPVTAGKYKATLTYNNMSIDTEYTISEREVVDDSTGNDETTNEGDSDIIIDEEDKDLEDDSNKKNPITSDSVIKYLILFIVGICSIVGLIILRKKGFFSKK